MNREDYARAAALQEGDETAALRFVLSREGGRAVLWGILEHCKVLGGSFTGEPLTTAFNEGRRDVGIRLWNAVAAVDPDSLAIMQTEHAARRARYHVTPHEREDL